MPAKGTKLTAQAKEKISKTHRNNQYAKGCTCYDVHVVTKENSDYLRIMKKQLSAKEYKKVEKRYMHHINYPNRAYQEGLTERDIKKITQYEI